MPARPSFAAAVLDGFRDAKILGVRAGPSHRYTAVWVVVLDGTPYVRSWNDKPTGWFQAFLHQPDGSVQLDGRELPVRAVAVRSARVRDAVSAAYAAKYPTKGSRKWVDGFREPARAANTLALRPR